MKETRTGLLLAVVLAAVPPADAGEIEIIRDGFGVPHVFADTTFDGAFGLGYAQAEDAVATILQYVMEARGEAAAAFGERRFIEQDFRFRAFGVPQISRELHGEMTAAERAHVDGFAEGVNEYLRQHPGEKPDWFDRMTGVDAVAVIKAYQVRQQLADVMKELEGAARPGGESGAAGGADGGASNMWCVGPARSADGEVMLLSDPHLPWSGATKWYESHLTVGDRWVYGAGFFGMAGLGIGFTQDVAWGSTNNDADMADVYRETLNPENGDQYLYDGRWRDVAAGAIEIAVKGQAAVRRVVRRTHHGPIVLEDKPRNVAFAARLAGLETMNMARLAEPYFQAKTVFDVYRADHKGDHHKGHRTLADRHGNIGYVYYACTHERDDQINWRLPVDGSTRETEWGPRIPFERLPAMFNPPAGFIVNCNNSPYTNTPESPIKPADYPRHLAGRSTTLEPSQRAHRAMELLDRLERIGMEDMERISMDVKALTADTYVDLILGAYDQLKDRIPGNSDDLKRAVEIIRSWDKMATVDNQALPILTTFIEVAGGGGAPRRKPTAQQVLSTLEQALARMRQRWGSVAVPWGDVHVIQRGDVLLPAAGAGSDRTPSPFTTLYMTGTSEMVDNRWPADRGSSWMMLVKYHGGAVEAKTILPWGNSPDPASPHYADQAPLFAKQQYKKALLTRPAIEADAESRITLKR